MEKKIVKENKSFITFETEKGVCPLNWLAEFYREYEGKLVMLTKEMVSYLLNDSHADAIIETEREERYQKFDIYWLATEKYPESKLTLASCGEHKIEQEDDEKYNVYSDANYYVIESLQAEDIIQDKNKPYAYNIQNDQQIVVLGVKPAKKTEDIYPETDLTVG